MKTKSRVHGKAAKKPGGAKKPGATAQVAQLPAVNGVLAAPGGEVLTLSEAAVFLRVAEGEVRQLAEAGRFPAKRLGAEWRILKSALCDWLRTPELETDKSYHERIMAIAGSMAHDDTAMQMLDKIYAERRKHPVSELQD